MAGVVLELLISLVFLCLGVVFLCGKGTSVISGYNSASKEEREKYDEKKLNRATGVLCIVISIIFGGITVLCYMMEKEQLNEKVMGPFVGLLVLFIFIASFVYMVLTNKYCLKK